MHQMKSNVGAAPTAYAARSRRATRSLILIAGVFLISSGSAFAQNPLLDAGLPDPGFANVSQNAQSGIYLGNQWFLTANHTVGGGPGNRNLQNILLDGVSYTPIPNSEVVLTNTQAIQNAGLLESADLLLYRLRPNADGLSPEATSENIRSLSLADRNGNRVLSPSDPDFGRLVLADGTASSRNDVLQGPLNNGTEINGPKVIAIDPFVGPQDLGFATNRIANDGNLETLSNGNPVDDFNNSLNAPVALGNGNIVGGVVGQILRQDSPGSAAATEFEFQASGGDSGTPIFVEQSDTGAFEFSGLLHGIFNNTPNGNFTLFSDLGNPIAGYREQIFDLFEDNQFSIAGDVNLDGVANEDDLFALAAGFDDEITEASISTYIRGDLNQDGDTDLADFALLRDALGGSVNVSDLQSAIAVVAASVAVPEPSTATIALLAGLAGLCGRRRH